LWLARELQTGGFFPKSRGFLPPSLLALFVACPRQGAQAGGGRRRCTDGGGRLSGCLPLAAKSQY